MDVSKILVKARNKIETLKFSLILFFTLLSFVSKSQNLSDSLVSKYYSLFYNGGIKEESQNWVMDSLKLDEGNYYQFDGKYNPNSDTIYIMNFVASPDMVLGYLLANGFHIEEAWFKKGDSNCGILDVMVTYQFLIRTKNDQQTTSLKRLGFKKTLVPSVGEFPYYVRHLHL